MKSFRLFFGALCVLGYLSPAFGATVMGPYVLGSFGARDVSNQDMNEFFALGNQPGPVYIPVYLGEACFTAGYRFTDPFALEASAGVQMGRDTSNLYAFGNVDLQVPSGSLFTASIAPVFCFDTVSSPSSAWFHQVGIRLEYGQVSGEETIQTGDGNASSLSFGGSALGWGLFYRLLNLWPPSRISVGAEAGYEFLKFTNLSAGNAGGVLAGQGGQQLVNLNGVPAFNDDSGLYFRLVVGWTPGSKGAADAGGEETDKDLLALARRSNSQGDKVAAAGYYHDHLLAHPKDGEAWQELGVLYEQNGQAAFAKRCFELAHKMGFNSVK